MVVEEKFNVRAPGQKVWDFFLQPKRVSTCIPGCEKVEIINEREYINIIKAKVGPISARFKVKTMIQELEPYRFFSTTGEGKEVHNLGHFKQKTSITLSELSEDETQVSYHSDISIVGRLGTFGDRILKAKAKELGKEFVGAVKQELEG